MIRREQNVRELVDKMLAAATAGGDRIEAYAIEQLRLANLSELHEMLENAADHKFTHFEPRFVGACVMLQIAQEVQRRMSEVKTGDKSFSDASHPPRLDRCRVLA